jgi:hypothetical protein
MNCRIVYAFALSAFEELLILGRDDTKLTEETETIPVYPAFHNFIVLDPIDPDAFRRRRRSDLCRITIHHFIIFCDQFL